MYSKFKISAAVCLIAAGTFLMSCNNNQNKSSDMKNHQHNETDNVYACLMHPEVTGKKGDKCSKCGMDLELVKKSNTNNIEVKIISTPKVVEAGKPTLLFMAITDNGKLVPLDVVHEKKIHLILVNDELTWFDHIHPEEQANGYYAVTETFPNGGKYLLFSDFKTSGASPTLNKQELEVSGNAVKKTNMVSDKWVSNVDGYTVTLVNGNNFKTNRTQHLELSIEKNGKQLSSKDIEPYLGAVAHVVMISKEDKEFKHIHPASNKRFPIDGETFLEKTGVYRIWVQFKTNGQVHTADFTVNVVHGDKESSEEKSHTNHH